MTAHGHFHQLSWQTFPSPERQKLAGDLSLGIISIFVSVKLFLHSSQNFEKGKKMNNREELMPITQHYVMLTMLFFHWN